MPSMFIGWPKESEMKSRYLFFTYVMEDGFCFVLSPTQEDHDKNRPSNALGFIDGTAQVDVAKRHIEVVVHKDMGIPELYYIMKEMSRCAKDAEGLAITSSWSFGYR